MDKILFSKRLKERRKAVGYTSTKAFAAAYNVRYNNKMENIDDDSGVLGTLKHYENPNHLGIPRLDIVENICEMLDCDVDYLLGKIDLPKHSYEGMYQLFGLSERVVDQLEYWNRNGYSDAMNTVLGSPNFDNALREASNYMIIVPTARALGERLEAKKVEIYSKPRPEGGYPKLTTLRELARTNQIQCDIARLNLTDNLTFLVMELEKIALERKAQKASF